MYFIVPKIKDQKHLKLGIVLSCDNGILSNRTTQKKRIQSGTETDVPKTSTGNRLNGIHPKRKMMPVFLSDPPSSAPLPDCNRASELATRSSRVYAIAQFVLIDAQTVFNLIW